MIIKTAGLAENNRVVRKLQFFEQQPLKNACFAADRRETARTVREPTGFSNKSNIRSEKMRSLKMKGSMAVMVLFLAGSAFAQSSGTLNVVKPAIADKDLVIQVAEITENAVFYPVDIEGTRLEVLAVKAPDGTIRTAFNTCQVCYGSGRGFYKQQGTVLVCQNCGNRFRMSQVEARSGGCNPVPIFPANKTVSAATITISREYLKEAKAIFARWKRS
jgi:uncharacterized membrane protein